MRAAAGFFAISVALIAAGWWWLGAPVVTGVTPFAPGEKLECVSYAPFRDDQTPLDLSLRISPEQIDDDLSRLAKLTNCVRTYSVHLGLDQVAPIAQRHGLKVLQGLWLGRDPVFNRVQIDAAIGLAKRYPDVIRAVVVGNEVLLRGELSGNDLANIVREVKAQVPVPVTYADVWEFWLRNRDLVGAVDFVTIHILPYWEDIPIPARDAAAHVLSIRRQVAAAFPGKEILIGEVGWPSAGRMREGALPSPSNQARVLQEVIAGANRENYRVNVIEAFDQPWKRRFEGTVGGYWGLLDTKGRMPKFAWGEPVSDHPYWRWQAAFGIGLAAIIFAGAFLSGFSRVRDNSSPWTWAGVGVTAIAAGILAGWTIENATVESFGSFGHARSVVLVAIAVILPILGTALAAAGQRTPVLARTFGPASERPAGLSLAVGIGLAVLTALAVQEALGLVFDPRYRDFAFAPLTAAIIPYGVLAATHGPLRGRGDAAQIAAAIVLALSAIYIVLNEGFANWQALWLSADLLALAVILALTRDVQS